MDIIVESIDAGTGLELEILRLGHGDANVFIDEFCSECAGDGLEGNGGGDVLLVAKVGGEEAEAASSVSTHFGFAAIGIVVAELEVGTFLGWFDGEKPIGTDAAMAIAEGGDGVLVEGDGEIAVINDNEVIAGAVHFVEVEKHFGKTLSDNFLSSSGG